MGSVPDAIGPFNVSHCFPTKMPWLESDIFLENWARRSMTKALVRRIGFSRIKGCFPEGLILFPKNGVSLASFLPVYHLTIAVAAVTTLCCNGGSLDILYA